MDDSQDARMGSDSGDTAGPDLAGPGMAAPEPDELTARRDAILLGMLPDVAFDGWTRTAMLRGAEAAGYEREAALASFPRGPVEVVEHFSAWADRAMLDQLAGTDLAALKVRERITLAVRTRLEILAPYREAVRRSAALLALPPHAAVGPRILYRTVDATWVAAGDTSTDYNFYTKRMLLAGVQTSTLLYWLEDRSEDNADTWAFLDRRIADVMRIGKGIGQIRALGGGQTGSGQTGGGQSGGGQSGGGARGPDLAGLMARLPNPMRFGRHLRRSMR
ncbi:MAG: hypothetical protein RLY86_1091 [Pseudomonadota bacterium]|jgi:ubiquinone biosynthesis protein COQ9